MEAVAATNKALGIEGLALHLPSAQRIKLWLDIEKKNRSYPIRLARVPRSEWPEVPEGVTPPKSVMRSREFLVLFYPEPNGILRLSIKRTNFDPETGLWDDDISWDDLQLLKHEAGFQDRPAVEIFPPNRDVVNVASMRHLWVLPEDPAFMWRLYEVRRERGRPPRLTQRPPLASLSPADRRS